MNRNFYKILLIVLLAISFVSCLPDRMPPEPVEINRPNFVKFYIGQSNLNVALNNQIQMYFNEKMDLSSFPNCFKVESISGVINGIFSYGAADTIVVFTPTSNYLPAEYYKIYLYGCARDANGMSLLSPNDENVPQEDWFFTSGQYSANGFPYIFIRDKANKNLIYRVGELNKYKDSIVLPEPQDYQVSSLEVEKNSDYLFVVNLKTSNGLVTVIDPATFQILKEIPVGLGPTNIAFSDQKAYVTNLSAKSFTTINLSSLSADSTYIFPDGFKPKDVVYSAYKNALYFTSSVNSDIKKVNADNYNDTKIISSGLTTRLTDIEITQDGKFLYLIGTNASTLSIIDLDSDTATVIDLGYQYLVDGTMGKDFYYVSYFKGIGGDNFGGILKIDINSKNIVNKIDWQYQADQIKLTAAEELIYAVTPTDSTVQVVETKSMNKITEIKVNGSLKFLAITNKNY
ncbi:MAG: Ig-like domain-containing protein [Ignavibacterium sp.]|uniref:Ig-like domain-containing protein n=1 Tax=Ignavibacterium sp. TaxID=2651167 RepID=UPI00404AA5FC